jgi:hypothetical protein
MAGALVTKTDTSWYGLPARVSPWLDAGPVQNACSVSSVCSTLGGASKQGETIAR